MVTPLRLLRLPLHARLLALGVALVVLCTPPALAPSAYAGQLSARGNPRAYAFMVTDDAGRPARWNPCVRIGYRVNTRHASPGALADTREALARISRVNGLRFVYRGRTRIVPGGRHRRVPRDTQLVVAWARPSESATLRRYRGAAGVGGPDRIVSAYNRADRRTLMITRGSVVLNADIGLGRGFRGGVHNGYYGTRGQLLMHEIGHVVGLDHPRQRDRRQIMYPTMTGKRAVWGAGDRRGLRRVGRAPGCLRAVR